MKYSIAVLALIAGSKAILIKKEDAIPEKKDMKSFLDMARKLRPSFLSKKKEDLPHIDSPI